MKQYTDLLELLLEQGERRDQARGMPTYSMFGHYLSFDLREGFPLVTVKAVPFKSVIAELVGFLKGVNDAKAFNELGTKIWDANADAEYWVNNPNRAYVGHLGRIYGVQWREFRSVEEDAHVDGHTSFLQIKRTDQIRNLIDGLIENPQGRRHIVTAWNPGELDQMALPPCHVMFQCYVSSDGYLDLQMHQRSCDAFLGLPFNIASYAALLTYLAGVCGYKPRHLKITLGDVHLYENQLEAAHKAVERIPMPLPQMHVRIREAGIAGLKVDDFVLENYQSHPALPVPMVV